jgi:nucleotide-binding universal stress UspA family protein
MKTILVPTDYSPVADNAVQYAAHLAEAEEARIILFHVFRFAIPTQDTIMPINTYADMENYERVRLDKYRKRMEKAFNNRVKFQSLLTPGLASDEIIDWCQDHKPDLVVMGISGGRGLKEFFAGSNALRVVKGCETDVLIVPAQATFQPVKKISLATDLENIDAETISSTLRHYCEVFHARAEIVNVQEQFSLATEEREENIQKLHAGLGDIKHSIKQRHATDVATEIENHIHYHKSQWLAVVHKDYNFFKGLFHRSITKQLAFHLSIPVLSINQAHRF